MKIFTGILFMLLLLVPSVLADVNAEDNDEESEIVIFNMGSAMKGGIVLYGVDRKNGICWVTHAAADGAGMALITCKAFKKIPKIQKFIETGKVD